MWQILFSLFNLIQMTIEPCPPQESFCATWAGNFGTFDKGIQWGLECSPGKRSKGGRAEDRESTTETPPNNSFWSKIFLTKMFFPKSTFPPPFCQMIWSLTEMTKFICHYSLFTLYMYQLYFLWVNQVINTTRNEITEAHKSAPVLGTWTPVLTLNPIPGPFVFFVIYSWRAGIRHINR